MGHTRKIKARTIVLSTLAICMFLTYALLPEVASVGWHVLHGSSAKFLVWEVPVPWGWRELEGDSLIVIQHVERWSNAPSNVIVTTLELPVGFGIDQEQWKKINVETQSKNGRHFVSENHIQFDGEFGFCFTFADNEHLDRRWVDCVFPIHRLSIGYIGTKDHSEILDSIIHNISASE